MFDRLQISISQPCHPPRVISPFCYRPSASQSISFIQPVYASTSFIQAYLFDPFCSRLLAIYDCTTRTRPLTGRLLRVMEFNMERVRPQPAEGRRRSIFTEVGLIDEDTARDARSPAPIMTTFKHVRPARTVRFRSRNSIFGDQEKDDESDWESVMDEDESDTRPITPTALPAQSTMPLRFYRLGIFACVLAIMLPILSMSPMSRVGVRGDTIPRSTIEAQPERSMVVKRDNSPTEACKRWAGQSTIVNGTLYMYGFRQNESPKDEQNTWSKTYHRSGATKLGKYFC